MNSSPGLIRKHPFAAYICITYVISWAIEIPLALKAQGITENSPPFAIHYLAAFGPFFGGLIITWILNGSEGLRELWSRTIRWRVAPVWWLVALSPILLFLLGAIVMRLVQGVWVDFSILNHFDFLPDIGVLVILVWLVTYGFGEEIGWRGFFLPRLQHGRSPWSATVILWLVWAAWHVPSFFYLHTASNAGALFGFLIGVLAGAIFLTWLYNNSGGSVLLVAVWHGLFDYTTACTECKSGAIAAGLSTLVMVWAMFILLKHKSTLSRFQKHSIPPKI